MFREIYSKQLAEYEKFWERKNTKRCTLSIAYKKNIGSPYREPKSLEEKRLDSEYNYGLFQNDMMRTGYMAEGLPRCFTNFGPGCLAACIGGEFELAPNTIWFDRVQKVTDWENPPKVVFDEQSEMWQHIVKRQERFARDPDICFTITDLGGILDVVASLRGTENLLYDLYDYPNEVIAFSKEVTAAWLQAFDLQVETVRRAGLPFNNWINLPSEKPWYPLQCDFSYMISPAQFEKFVLDDLVTQANHMDRSIYHLDGVGELPHVDMLLNIPNLTGIQWVPGAGQLRRRDPKWFDLYRRIQDAKKNLVLEGDAISEYDLAGSERLIKSLDPTGLYISCHCSSEDKAKQMLELVERWSE